MNTVMVYTARGKFKVRGSRFAVLYRRRLALNRNRRWRDGPFDNSSRCLLFKIFYLYVFVLGEFLVIRWLFLLISSFNEI